MAIMHDAGGMQPSQWLFQLHWRMVESSATFYGIPKYGVQCSYSVHKYISTHGLCVQLRTCIQIIMHIPSFLPLICPALTHTILHI